MNSAEVNIMAMNLDREREVRQHITRSRALRELAKAPPGANEEERHIMTQGWRVVAGVLWSALARLPLRQGASGGKVERDWAMERSGGLQ